MHDYINNVCIFVTVCDGGSGINYSILFDASEQADPRFSDCEQVYSIFVNFG